MKILPLISVLLLVATAATAQVSPELKPMIQKHADLAKAEGGAGVRELKAGNTAAGCMHLKTSKDEIGKVRSLLELWRQQAMTDTSRPQADIIAEMNRVDEMTGAWLGTENQIDKQIAAHCPQ